MAKQTNQDTSQLNSAIAVLESENLKLKSEINTLNDEKSALIQETNQLNSGIAVLESENLKLKSEINNLHAEKSACIQEFEKASSERDAALEIVTDLSQQVADQSTVKTEKEIMVNVDGVKYILERRSLHTPNGEIKPEDMAKDIPFLRDLIATSSGNIRPASK